MNCKDDKNGDIDAQNQLGWDAWRVKDYKKAVCWWKKTAAQGDAEGQTALSWMVRNGWGVANNEKKAFDLAQKSAEQGYDEGQYNLGWMHLQGIGVEQDDEQARHWARHWWKKAAKQGHEKAQKALRDMDEKRGSSENKELSCEKAAKQGDAEAQFNLGAMYSDGRGRPENYIKAHALLNLAAASGHESAKSLKEELAKKMTKEDISKAQELAWQWFDQQDD